MTRYEVALQLTLALLEKDGIDIDKYPLDDYGEMEKQNSFNAKQISDAFNNIRNGIGD